MMPRPMRPVGLRGAPMDPLLRQDLPTQDERPNTMASPVRAVQSVTDDGPKGRAGAAGQVGEITSGTGAREYDNRVIAQLMAVHDALREAASIQEKAIRKSAKRYKLGIDAARAIRKVCTPKRKAAASTYHAAQLMVIGKRGWTDTFGPIGGRKPSHDEIRPND